jgi:hypothetical protein
MNARLSIVRYHGIHVINSLIDDPDLDAGSRG